MSLRYIKKQDDASAISKLIEIDPVLLEQYWMSIYEKEGESYFVVPMVDFFENC